MKSESAELNSTVRERPMDARKMTKVETTISKRCTIGFEERCLVVYRFDGTVVMRLTIEEQAKRGISIDDIYRAIGLRPKAVPARQSVGLVNERAGR